MVQDFVHPQYVHRAVKKRGATSGWTETGSGINRIGCNRKISEKDKLELPPGLLEKGVSSTNITNDRALDSSKGSCIHTTYIYIYNYVYLYIYIYISCLTTPVLISEIQEHRAGGIGPRGDHLCGAGAGSSLCHC